MEMDEAKIQKESSAQLVKETSEALSKLMKTQHPDLDEVKASFELYTFLIDQTEKLHGKYMSALAKASETKDHQKVAKELAELRRIYMLARIKVGKLLGPTAQPAPSPQQVINVTTPASLPPRHELVKFNGDARQWLAFWACFKRYHEDTKIPLIDKFHYLLSAMVTDSPADKAVRISPVCEENYQEAIDRLHNQFGRPSLIVKVYVRELLKLVVSNASGKKTNFIDVVTQISSRINNLAALGVTSEKCADILYPVVESALPEDIFMAWQRATKEEEDLDTLLAFLQKEVNQQTERQLAREQFSQFGSPTPSTSNNKSGNGNSHSNNRGKSSSGKTTSFANAASASSCLFCDKAHPSSDCDTARKWSLEKRRQVLRENKCCTNCLEPGHFYRYCKTTIKCELCQRGHYSFMCPLLAEKSSESKASAGAKPPKKDADKKNVHFKEANDEEPKASTSTDMKNTVQSAQVPLQTICTYAHGRNGQRQRVRIMFDSGSQNSYILSPIAKQLNLEKVGAENLIHNLFGGVKSPPTPHDKVRLYLANKDGSNNGNFVVYCTDIISHNIVSPLSGPWIQEFAAKGVTFSDFGTSSGQVDILIGNDVRPHCFTGRKIKLHDGPGPVAEETIWGWVLGGKLPSDSDNNSSTMLVTNLHVSDRPISDLWALETIGIRDSAEKESRTEMDKQAVAHFQQTVKRDDTGRYEVALPWLEGMKERLPNNYFACVRRLKSTTTQLQKSGYLEHYSSLFNTWEIDNMIERIPEEKEPHLSIAQYLPHRAVIKLTSSTTPVRPVFDASASLKGHPSLNECVDKGANTLELIPAILTRFRMYQVGFLSDIKKAFQQINVAPEDRDYIRFLWWEDSTCQKIRIYRHTRVVFGVSASPFLLGITLQHHLNTMYPESPYTSLLLKNMYVDNLVASLPSFDQAYECQQQSQQMLLPAQFDLRGWEFGPDDNDRELPVLGLLWNTKKDYLRLDTSAAKEKLSEDKALTQRSLLSLAHCLFDPIGLISPFSLLAKLLLRRCQEVKMGWDTTLPLDISKDVDKWTNQISHLEEVKLPRYSQYGESSNHSLHIFCDASASAYAAVAFLRTETANGVEVSFLQSRSRVAPKSKATIPRLELLSCNIGARLYNTIKEDLQVKSIPVKLHTDSTTAEAWIKGIGPWGVFVGNRKAEINKLTNVEDWRHIPGKYNPADLPSRGCSAAQLVESRWWVAPNWLRLPQSEWPTSNEQADTACVDAERKKTVVSFIASNDSNPFNGLLRVSSYPKILRILTYVVQFKRALRQRVPAKTQSAFPPDEQQEAEFTLIRHVQQQLPLQENHLKKLRPFEDEYGIIRTRTRLIHDEEEDFKRPIILPQQNEFVSKMIMWEHQNRSHMGTEMLLAHLRERFWIVHGRRTIRKIVNSCFICKKFLTRPLQVPEAPLPISRTTPGYAFETTGVDATGPIILKNKKKVWIILFTCAVYRGVHMEVVESLSTDSFLRAFRHFIARRNRPNLVISDNGLNFVGAQRAIARLDRSKVLEYAATLQMKWTFNAPTASWWGGFFERMIGVVKGLMKRVLGRKLVHLHELVTLCIEVEEAVNNRPLTYISEDPQDPQPLTPNHFIKIQHMPALFPEADVIDAQHLRAAFRKLQHLREALRSRFRTEYLGQLQHNNASTKLMKLKENDVVIVHNDNAKRQDWQVGVIETPLFSDKDGIPRSYIVKVTGGKITRPAQHLYPMEISDDDSATLRAIHQDNNSG